MTEKQYNELNDYLNDILMELNKANKIFVDNFMDIFKVTAIIFDRFHGKSIKSINNQNNITFNEVYLLSREIIENINPKYLEKFDNIIENGELNFDYEEEYYDSHVKTITDNNHIKKEINIKRTFSYDDVLSLIHEFFHYLNSDVKRTQAYEFFTEFISIYFELIAKEYLLNKKNVSVEEVNTNSRIISLLRNNYKCYNYITILLAYEELGNINNNTINDMNKILEIKDAKFDKECIHFLEQLNDLRKNNSHNDTKEEMTTLVKYNYRYIVGTLLSYYAIKHCKIEDIVRFNDQINSNEYADLSIYKILNTIGIEVNGDMINESLDIIDKSIYIYDERVKTK